MKTINLEEYPIILKEVCSKIKSELSINDIAFGVSNPKREDLPLFIPTKQGKEFNWGYAEVNAHDRANFYILGSPCEWIRLTCVGYPHNQHSANAEFEFSVLKTISGELDTPPTREEHATYFWHARYNPYGEILTPMNKGTYFENMRYAWSSINGQGEPKRTYWDNHLVQPEKETTNILAYLSSSQLLDFYKRLVDDLSVASPAAAEYVVNKFTLLKQK